MWYLYVAFYVTPLDALIFQESSKLMLSFTLMKFTFSKFYPENRMYNKQFSTGVSGEIRFVAIANQIVAWGRSVGYLNLTQCMLQMKLDKWYFVKLGLIVSFVSVLIILYIFDFEKSVEFLQAWYLAENTLETGLKIFPPYPCRKNCSDYVYYPSFF